MIVDYGTLHQVMEMEFPNAQVSVVDRFYSVPSIEAYEAYLRGFSKWLKAELGNGAKWREDIWDCDNFAKAFIGYASMRHLKTLLEYPHVETGSLPIAEIHYTIDGGGRHAINAFAYKVSDTRIEIGTIEPQANPTETRTSGVFHLSNAEKESVTKCDF